MGKDTSDRLEDFFSGGLEARFSSRGHSVLLPDMLRTAVVMKGIPFEAFLNQGVVAGGTCWSLKEVMETIERIYHYALVRIRAEGLFSQVLPVLRYHKNLRRIGMTPARNIPRPDFDAQLKISRIIIEALHSVHGKERRLTGHLCEITDDPKKRKANWDMHEKAWVCLTYCLHYVSVAPRFGLRAELYKVPNHVIVGLSFGNRLHFIDPTRGENDIPSALIRSEGGHVYDYRNPCRIGYFGVVSALLNKALAFELRAQDSKNPGRSTALLIEAIKATDDALEADPEEPRAWQQRAKILRKLAIMEKNEKSKRIKQVLDAYCKSIGLYKGRLARDGNDAEAWSGIANSLYYLCDLVDKGKKDELRKEAIEAFNKVLELDCKDENALTNKGSLLMWLGKIDEAEEAFDRSLELNDQNAAAWAGKGEVLLQRGMAGKALKMIDFALKINAKVPFFWALKAAALEKLGRHEEIQKAKAAAG